MALFFDIVPGQETEHDHWHTHEHFGERLAIPGFLRASRWTAVDGAPRYFVMYEVADVGVLTSAAYLARLDNPSPWTRRMMPHYRGMVRGLTRVACSAGHAIAGHAAVLRIEAAAGRGAALDAALASLTADLAQRPGLSGAHLLAAAVEAPMTQEQAIRGRDATVDRVLIAVGYDEAAVHALTAGALAEAALTALGARPGCLPRIYRLGATATAADAST